MRAGLHVVIRINLDKHNLNTIDDLFKDMCQRGYNEFPGLQLNLEIVSPIMNPSFHCKKYTFEKEDELKTLAGMWKKQVEYGFPIKSIMPVDSACENLVENSYTISSNGDFYMCPGFVGIKDFIIGNIMENGLDEHKYKELLSHNVWKECIDCEYAPVCQGGCKMCAYVVNGKFGSTYCRKDFVTAVYPEFLKSKYNLI